MDSIFLVCLLEQDDGRVAETLFTVPVPRFLKYQGTQTPGEGHFSKALDKLQQPSYRKIGNAMKERNDFAQKNPPNLGFSGEGSPSELNSPRISEYLSDMGPDTQDVFLKPNTYLIKRSQHDTPKHYLHEDAPAGPGQQKHRRMQQNDSALEGTPPKDPAEEREMDLLASYVVLGSPKVHDASSILEMIEEISPLPRHLASNESKRKVRTVVEFKETESGTKRAKGAPRPGREDGRISDAPAHPVSLAFNVRTPSWALGHALRPGAHSDPGHLERKAPPSSPRLFRKVISHGRVRQVGARKPRLGARSARKRLRF